MVDSIVHNIYNSSKTKLNRSINQKLHALQVDYFIYDRFKIELIDEFLSWTWGA